MESLEAEPLVVEPWLELGAVMRAGRIYPDLRGRLRALTESLPLGALRARSENALGVVLSMQGATLAGGASLSDLNGLLARLRLLLSDLGEIPESSHPILEQVVDVVYFGWMGLPAEDRTSERLFASLSKLFAGSVPLCEQMAPTILRLRDTLPSSARGDFAELLFVCRSRTQLTGPEAPAS